MEQINQSIAQFLLHIGIDKENINWSLQILLIICIALLSYITTKLFRYIIIPAVQKITSRTKARWDDFLFNEKMMISFCRLIPPLVWYILLPLVFSKLPLLLEFLQKACEIYLVVCMLLLISAFLNSLYEISNEHETLRNRPLKGIYQMIKLIAFGIGFIVIISIITDSNATSILAGLGASAAVLMLIFKDSLLGLVAGVQLSANDMLRPGDWITMPKYGADGDVIEVSLTTVKVRNFDKTITTIPPYVLVSDSFQNWRGMRDTGGRRIKRSINIDLNTIRFCTEEEKKRLVEKGWIKDNTETEELTNLSAFTSYLQEYLVHHPHTHKELMIMVRQLQPTSEGLPLEIYCFTDTTVWMEYENIQNGIFNHLLAVLPQFGLRAFQRPAGKDINDSVIPPLQR